MTHLVCGGCHVRAAAPVGLAAPRGARRSAPVSHGRPAAGAPRGAANPVAGLVKEGITRDQIQTMGREIPGALLMG